MIQSKIESYPPTVVVEPKIVPMPEAVARVNHNPELTRSNIRKNIELDVEQISPYETQCDSVVALVAELVNCEWLVTDVVVPSRRGR